MKDDLITQALGILQQYIKEKHGGNRTAAMQALGMNTTTALLGKWLRGERVPSMSSLAPILEKLGVTLTAPENEAGKDICFVNAKVVAANENSCELPVAEDYIAAPLVGEVGAGPGYIPQEQIKSWFLVYRNLAAVRYRRNLIAVEIGKNSTSMTPTLNPGDIVLVDRDDRQVDRPGHIMLVLDPMDGSGMIKRVAINEKDGGDFGITYYSDNVAENPPISYSLQKDFGGDFEKAIVGRVIWAWADIRDK